MWLTTSRCEDFQLQFCVLTTICDKSENWQIDIGYLSLMWKNENADGYDKCMVAWTL